MDLEVRHLQLVAAVADVGSLTKAGDRLHLTQSALSHQLRDIEARLGAALFLRLGKRLVLTPAGERLLESARDVLERLRQTEDAIRRLGHERAGVLRITTECTTCYHWLPPLLSRYRRRFPGIEVRIDVEATTRPIQRLLDGAIDLALVSSTVRDRRLSVRPVFTDQVVVIVSPQHHLAARRRVALADIRDETLYIYPPKQESLFLQQVLVPAGVVPARIEEVRLTEAIIELVKANLGVSALARWAVQPFLDAGTVVSLPIPPRGLQRHWAAVMPKDLARVDYVAEFIDLLERHSPGLGSSTKVAPIAQVRRKVRRRVS
jgi:LysR family transcriptional regulator, regulator for metE and metH